MLHTVNIELTLKDQKRPSDTCFIKKFDNSESDLSAILNGMSYMLQVIKDLLGTLNGQSFWRIGSIC